jgi:hypothetical protein
LAQKRCKTLGVKFLNEKSMTQNPFEPIVDRLTTIEKYLVKFDERFTPPKDSTPEAPDRFVGTDEARKLLGGVSSPTLWEWRNKKIITGYRIGNKVMYKYSELMACGKLIVN